MCRDEVRANEISAMKPEPKMEDAGVSLGRDELANAGAKTGFNGLTASEWAALSKNVWNDLSSPRNKYQLEHGATFPLKLADRLIKMYSREGDYVLDPFAGIGTTLVAAQSLGRNAFGTELIRASPNSPANGSTKGAVFSAATPCSASSMRIARRCERFSAKSDFN